MKVFICPLFFIFSSCIFKKPCFYNVSPQIHDFNNSFFLPGKYCLASTRINKKLSGDSVTIYLRMYSRVVGVSIDTPVVSVVGSNNFSRKCIGSDLIYKIPPGKNKVLINSIYSLHCMTDEINFKRDRVYYLVVYLGFKNEI